jgi:hypothetical protein
MAAGIVLGSAIVAFVPLIGLFLGPVVGLALVTWGAALSIKKTCSRCGQRIEDGRAASCPGCGEALTRAA